MSGRVFNVSVSEFGKQHSQGAPPSYNSNLISVREDLQVHTRYNLIREIHKNSLKFCHPKSFLLSTGVHFGWKGAYKYEIYQNFKQSKYYSPERNVSTLFQIHITSELS